MLSFCSIQLFLINRPTQFYDIPQSTPDLSTHMEDLAWQYPAEPVERAAVRFCEAIEKWRGKPELETVSLRLRHPHSFGFLSAPPFPPFSSPRPPPPPFSTTT